MTVSTYDTVQISNSNYTQFMEDVRAFLGEAYFVKSVVVDADEDEYGIFYTATIEFFDD